MARRNSLTAFLGIAAVGVFATSVVFIGCGGAHPAGPAVQSQAVTAAPAPAQAVVSPPVGQTPIALDAYLQPAITAAAASGSITGKMKTDSGEQLFTLNIYPQNLTQNSSGTFSAFVTFSTSGPLGQFQLPTSYLERRDVVNQNYNDDGSFDNIYDFMTPELPSPLPSNSSNVSLELVIALRNGTTFDPEQSSVNILDCWLSGPCGNAPYVMQSARIGKRR